MRRFMKNMVGYMMGGDWQGESQPSDASEASADDPEDAGRGFARRMRSSAAPGAPAGPAPGPVLEEAEGSDGGIQGFNWYINGQLRDSDGDEACGFLVEAVPSRWSEDSGSASAEDEGSFHSAKDQPLQRPALFAGKGAARPAMMEVPLTSLYRSGRGWRRLGYCIDGNLACVSGPPYIISFV